MRPFSFVVVAMMVALSAFLVPVTWAADPGSVAPKAGQWDAAPSFVPSRGPLLSAGALACAEDATAAVSTNEGGCWDTCKTCEAKCQANQACKERCWSTNNACCKGAGGKGIYKLCGCTDN